MLTSLRFGRALHLRQNVTDSVASGAKSRFLTIAFNKPLISETVISATLLGSLPFVASLCRFALSVGCHLQLARKHTQSHREVVARNLCAVRIPPAWLLWYVAQPFFGSLHKSSFCWLSKTKTDWIVSSSSYFQKKMELLICSKFISKRGGL